MKRLVLGITLLLSLGVTALATDWPVWVPKETGRVAVATTGNSWTACTQIPFTKAWNYAAFSVESVLDSNGATQPGNAGLGVRLRKGTSTMPNQTAALSSTYKYFSPSALIFEDRDQSSSAVITYYADTTLTTAAGATTRINLIYETWKILRQ